ncbi:MAG: DUF120 domain-containing protein [archaeon]|nr:DUF120 domain-containing protein [archaeon]MCP8313831.1 DUF120 domain-containing protein [archaeon]MCP8319605.1 DUF120 domain-containing protein [archaeon]
MPILIELLLSGAKDSPIKISTIEISKRIGKSQQLASKHLLELENEGYVERFKGDRQYSIKLTEKGLNQLVKLYLALREVLEAPPSVIEIEGELFSGLEEGAYYVSLENYRRQFIDKLGFDPYIGTLNLKLTSSKDRKLRHELEHYSGISIDGFKNEHRTYGGAKCFMAVVNDLVEGAVGVFERSHYDDSVLEVISPIKIREKLGLKDGDRVKVKVFLESPSKPKIH